MEGPAGDPYRRPARRTQWLLSALAHHYGLDRGVENEIVVLATGLDQYLQEVFHHLDCRGAGRLPRADFRALCAVLGLRTEGSPAGSEAAEDAAAGGADSGDVSAGEGDADVEEEARLALCAEPPELTFRQFHARLCGYFGARAGARLPRGALSEHIETQIRLRRPRRRRRASREPGPDGGPDGERVARLEEENGSLRELVEDLRAALQSSDARCLALQVGLWKSQAGGHEEGLGGPEAAAERELRQARGALAAAEARAGRLRQGQAEVRRRAEEARQAVLRSLRRVRELEALAQQVPGLRRWVQQLEAELQRYRSEGPQLPTPPRASPEPGDRSDNFEDGGTRDVDAAPRGAWSSDSSSGSRALDEVGEQLFRSVEGQAASDEEEEEEEEEEKWREMQRPPAAEALLARPSSCGSGCDDRTAKKLTTYCSHLGAADRTCTPGELEAHVARPGTQGCGGKALGTPREEAELQRRAEESEHLRLELQMVETERVRLALLEEKLVDVLQLLQRLRDLNISKRALGKTLLSALDACRDPAQEGRSGPSATLDALHQALASCQLLRRQSPAPAPATPVLPNPLLISC
nr:EF-hand and coiled-coil domain-containing protein 1 [Oryctolagus cuniculus]